jgi:rubrerythrin
MSNFEIGEMVMLNGKEYKIVGTVKRSFKLERDGKFYKATAKMMGLEWNRIWDKDAKMPKTEDDHMNWFSRLCTELSPENLHCDGEISRTAAMKKYRNLMAEWKEIEKSLGRKVTEDEVYNWESRNRKW